MSGDTRYGRIAASKSNMDGCALTYGASQQTPHQPGLPRVTPPSQMRKFSLVSLAISACITSWSPHYTSHSSRSTVLMHRLAASADER